MPGDNSAWTPALLESPHVVPDKARRIRQMFNAIAPRYELVNSIFSLGLDSTWRRRAVKLANVRGCDTVLDIASGTGDFARAFARAGPKLVTGCDFAREMLSRAACRSPIEACWCEADALHLPFWAESFSITSCAFGVRNFHDLDAGLAEMCRVLKVGGRAVILEFTRPTHPLARRVYELYSTRFMPLAASAISQDHSGAYRYLPRSVVSFCDADEMRERLQRAGFTRVTARPMTLGVVTVYLAFRE